MSPISVSVRFTRNIAAREDMHTVGLEFQKNDRAIGENCARFYIKKEFLLGH